MRKLVVLLCVGLVASPTASGTGSWPGSAGLFRPTAVVAACGVERWDVKTLTDPDAANVRFTPRWTTVDPLRRLRSPGVGRDDPRIGGVETTTYRLRGRLVEMKYEEDRDIHLVIAQPGRRTHTMIVEFPAYSCTRGALKRQKMRTARSALRAACGRASRSTFSRLRGSATITGVGFFDVKHGQTGVAPNGIELHPVIGFKLTSATCVKG